jgi:RNA polymerase sigma factor (TIGR02999 family)
MRVANLPEPTAAVSVTQLLRRIREGEADAESELFPLVYSELRDLAARLMRGERVGHTLQPTDLVHESFFKLMDGAAATAADRRHFLSIASRAMRQVLVSHARKNAADKRGGGMIPLRITNVDAGLDVDLTELVALDDALSRLGELNPRLPRVIELRFFAGLSEAETAEALEVTPRTIQRDWAMARAWLYKEMYGAASS